MVMMVLLQMNWLDRRSKCAANSNDARRKSAGESCDGAGGWETAGA